MRASQTAVGRKYHPITIWAMKPRRSKIMPDIMMLRIEPRGGIFID
jgi:hypothetical protein